MMNQRIFELNIQTIKSGKETIMTLENKRLKLFDELIYFFNIFNYICKNFSNF